MDVVYTRFQHWSVLRALAEQGGKRTVLPRPASNGMKPQAWHAIIGAGLACIGLAIIGSVAYILYGPGFSLSFLTNTGNSQSEAQEYVCGDVTVKIQFEEDRARVELDGQSVEVIYTPAPEGVEVPPDAWDRYATSDASFVLWKRGATVLLQENGVVTHGECVLNTQ